MLPPETGPINGTGVGGDAYMARHHGGDGMPRPPAAKVVLRVPFQRTPWGPTGDDLTHPAWNGGLVEPPRTFEDGSVLPGGQAPSMMGRPGAVVVIPADALARDLARYRGVVA